MLLMASHSISFPSISNLRAVFPPCSAFFDSFLRLPRKARHGSVTVMASGESKDLSAVFFEPLEEVKKELVLVPHNLDVSLAKHMYTDDAEDSINRQINVEYNISFQMTNKHFNFDNGGSVPLNTPRFFQPLLPGFSQKLSIPSAFLKHIIQKKTAKLWTYSEKIFWPVKIQGNAPNLYFGQGWKQFTEDNDLHIGYFLVFRHEGDMNFSVIVLDTTLCEKDNMMTQTLVDESVTNVSEATAKIREPPKFRVTLQLRNLKGHYYMYVPVEFKRKTEITKKRQLFLKDPKSELWQVEITHSSENRTVLTRGWKEFCLSNNLRPGDDCEFQLASKENGMIILQVRIFRKSKSQRLEAIKRRPKSGWDIKDMSFWSTGRTVVQPFLSIPNAFVAASGLLQKQKATLRNQKGELFDVILRRQTRNRVMLGGWKFFVAVNKLKASDVCHFKLMSDSKDNPYFM